MNTLPADHEASTAIRECGLRNLVFLRNDQRTSSGHLDWLRCAERLSEADCDDIVSACSEFPLTSPSTVGEDRYPSHRQADTRKIFVNPATAWIFNLLCTVAVEANQNAYHMQLTSINRPPQYVEYRPGWGHFDCHNDYRHGLEEAPRKLTIILQLSSPLDYEGGKLQIFGAELEDLPSERGTVLAFPSFLYHRVTPVTSGVRRALVAWIAGPRLR